MAGYSTAFTIRAFDENELGKVEEFAKNLPKLIAGYCQSQKVTDNEHQISKLLLHFLGMHNASDFRFFAGERLLLLRIGEWVKAKVSRDDGLDDFSYFGRRLNIKRGVTTNTVIGDLFREYVVSMSTRNIYVAVLQCSSHYHSGRFP